MSQSSHPPFEVLLSRDELLRKIAELGREICAAHPDPGALVVVSIVEGARVFCRELMRHLPAGIQVHEIRASSYGAGTVSSGRVDVSGGDGIDCAGKTVLLVEDIVDTGRTIDRLRAHFLGVGAAKVTVATLLTKPSRREVEVDLEHQGFEIDDHFVIGFGMDVAGRYRELQEVVLYDQAVEAQFLGGAMRVAESL
jgi:hypoxanthine phosphoribosyltransferase